MCYNCTWENDTINDQSLRKHIKWKVEDSICNKNGQLLYYMSA